MERNPGAGRPPGSSRRLLRGDWRGTWELVWRRDDPYTVASDGRAFFDSDTGRVYWACWREGDESGLPEPPTGASVEEIPALKHSDHHVIFGEFFRGLPPDVQKVCNRASIGGFLKDQSFHFDDAYGQEWREFHDERLRVLATDWLRARGFDIDWG